MSFIEQQEQKRKDKMEGLNISANAVYDVLYKQETYVSSLVKEKEEEYCSGLMDTIYGEAVAEKIYKQECTELRGWLLALHIAINAIDELTGYGQ